MTSAVSNSSESHASSFRRFAWIPLFLIAVAAFLAPHLAELADPRLTLALGHDAPEHTWSARAMWSGIDVAPDSPALGTPNWPLTAAGTLVPTVILPWSWMSPWNGVLAVLGLLWALTLLTFASLLAALLPDSLTRKQERIVLLAGAGLPALNLGWVWYAGFLNWYAAMAFAFAGIAVSLRHRPTRPIHHVFWAVFVLFIGHLHIAAAVFIGTWLFVWHVLRRDADVSWQRRILQVLGWGAPVLGLIALVLTTDVPQDGIVQDVVWTVRSPADALGRTGLGGPWWRWLPGLAAAIIGVSLTLARENSTERRQFALWTGFLMLAGWLMPFSIPGWDYVAPRLAWVGIAGGCMLLLTTVHRMQLLVSILFALWSFFAITWSVDLARSWFATDCGHIEELVLNTQGQTPRGLRGSVFLQSCDADFAERMRNELPRLNFATHLETRIVELDAGIHTGFGFDPTIHSWIFDWRVAPPPGYQSYFRYDEPPAELSPADAELFRAAALTKVAQNLSMYAGPVLIANESQLQALLPWGFEVLGSYGSLHRLRWVGCPLTLHVSGTQPWAWRGGWIPTSDPWHGGEYPAGTSQTSPQTVGCGLVWVEIRAADGSTCNEADANGWQVIDTRRQQSVQCTL